mgnify:CR=1 FL=1
MALDIFTGIQRACCFCNSSQPSPLGATAMTSKYAEKIIQLTLKLPDLKIS